MVQVLTTQDDADDLCTYEFHTEGASIPTVEVGVRGRGSREM